MSSNSSSTISTQDNGYIRTKTSSNPSISHLPSTNTKKHHHRLKGHNRSFSHNKVLNKLSTSTSSPMHASKPNLNRSKSTDGLFRTSRNSALRRSNRSLTKLAGLQPLTKTVSNQSVKSSKSTTSLKGYAGSSNNLAPLSALKINGRKGKAILRLNDDDLDNNEYEDLDEEETSGTSPVRFDPRNSSDGRLPDNFSDSVFKRQTNTVNENEGNSPERQAYDISNKPKIGGSSNESVKSSNESSLIGNELQSKAFSENDQQEATTSSPPPNLVVSAQSSTDDLVTSNNLYGGSLLLSQSTGLTKKIDSKTANHVIHQKLIGTEVYTNKKDGLDPIPQNQSSIESNNSESVSGISFKAKANPFDSVAEPVITNQNAIQNNSYQPNQTIFNNLQRTNSQYISTKKQQQQLHKRQYNSSINNGTNNFSNFLNNNQLSTSSQYDHNNIETRTQQRLWLQRENSLMDVSNLDSNQLSNFSSLSLSNLMFSHNYNQSSQNIRELQYYSGLTPLNAKNNANNLSNSYSSGVNENNSINMNNINGLLVMIQNNQNSIQSRTEYERLNREYLNVRRHLNPVGESLNRVQKIINSMKGLEVSKTKKANGTSSLLSSSRNNNSNTFREFSPVYQEKEQETNVLLNKLWQDALISSSSSVSSSSGPLKISNQQQLQPQTQHQRQLNHRGPSLSKNQSFTNLRSSQTPTTRAVKLAAAQGSTQSNSSHLKRGAEQLVNLS